jgi:hypothetical protein
MFPWSSFESELQQEADQPGTRESGPIGVPRAERTSDRTFGRPNDSFSAGRGAAGRGDAASFGIANAGEPREERVGAQVRAPSVLPAIAELQPEAKLEERGGANPKSSNVTRPPLRRNHIRGFDVAANEPRP